MQDVLKGRSFNIRVSFDSEGVPCLGWVHSQYQMSEHVTEVRRIPESEHLAIALALGIQHSSVHHSINRKLRGLSKEEQEAAQAVNAILSSLEAAEISENPSKSACNA